MRGGWTGSAGSIEGGTAGTRYPRVRRAGEPVDTAPTDFMKSTAQQFQHCLTYLPSTSVHLTTDGVLLLRTLPTGEPVFTCSHLHSFFHVTSNISPAPGHKPPLSQSPHWPCVAVSKAGTWRRFDARHVFIGLWLKQVGPATLSVGSSVCQEHRLQSRRHPENHNCTPAGRETIGQTNQHQAVACIPWPSISFTYSYSLSPRCFPLINGSMPEFERVRSLWQLVSSICQSAEPTCQISSQRAPIG